MFNIENLFNIGDFALDAGSVCFDVDSDVDVGRCLNEGRCSVLVGLHSVSDLTLS